MYPREAFFREYVPRWLQFSRPIEGPNIEMRFGRQPDAFTSQGRSAPGTKPAPGFSQRRVELAYFALGDRISRLFERNEYRSRRSAVSTATLAMAPVYIPFGFPVAMKRIAPHKQPPSNLPAVSLIVASSRIPLRISYAYVARAEIVIAS
jgi:hypothetical protein